MSIEDTNTFLYANEQASKYEDAYEKGFNKFKKNRQSIRDIRKYGIRHYKSKMTQEPNVNSENYISNKKKMDKLYSKLISLICNSKAFMKSSSFGLTFYS
jgi:hypothetical protein